MKGLARRMVACATAGLLALGGLVGCGAQSQPDPTNAAELVQRYHEAENANNCHFGLDYDIEMSMFGQSMPVTAKLDMDLADGGGHGTMTMSAFDEDSTTEMYMAREGDTYVQYVSEEDGAWTKSEVADASFSDQLTDEAILSDAEFAATEDGYTLTVPGEKLFEALGSLGGASSMLDELGDESFAESMKGTEAVYTFDKDCLLKGIDYAFDYAYDAGSLLGGDEESDAEDAESLSLAVDMQVTIAMTFDGYGTVDAATVAVPDDVKAAAVDSGSIEDSIASLFGDEEDAVEEAEDEAIDEAVDEAEEQADAA